jgi:putative transcriptional regulator
MEQLSNNIRELRFKNDEMTQKALAERVGISRQTMNAIENCHHAPTVSVAIRIADVFRVPVDHLFTLDYEGKPAPIKQLTKATVDRSLTPIKEPATEPQGQSPTSSKVPLSVESRHAPVAEKADHQLTLADLRNVIGS